MQPLDPAQLATNQDAVTASEHLAITVLLVR